MIKQLLTKNGELYEVDLPDGPYDDTYIICPVCNPTRKREHQKERKLALKDVPNNKGNTKTIWRCNHCDESGIIYNEKQAERAAVKPLVGVKKGLSISSGLAEWFWNERRISLQTLKDFNIKIEKKKLLINRSKEKPELKGQYILRKCITFPYYYRNTLINKKYRDKDKNFAMVKNADKILFNIDAVRGKKTIVITEGEIDALSYHEAGFKEACSVPNGVSMSEKERKHYEETGKLLGNSKINLEYIDLCIDDLERAERIIICTDDDPPGIKLREELSRRLGRSRCEYVVFSKWNKKNGEPCNDPNDVLFHNGKEELLNTLKYTEKYPLENVVEPKDCWDEISLEYDQGIEKGVSTGYKTLDAHLNWVFGWLYIGNGYFGEGKSTFWFNLIIISIIKYQWKWALYCPENYPPKNIINSMVEMIVGSPVGINMKNRMSKDRLKKTVFDILQHHIYFVSDTQRYTPADIRDICGNLIVRNGIHAMLVDPWKNLKHEKKKFSIDEYIQEQLNEEVNFATKNNIIKIISHHPPTPERDKNKEYKPPSPYELIGGQVWSSTCYGMVCVHREDKFSFDNTNLMVIVQKIKEQKIAGIPNGMNRPVILKMERKSGRLLEERIKEDPFSDEKKQWVYPIENTDTKELEINFNDF